MTWLDGPATGFDTETTGTDPQTCRLVTATVVGVTVGEYLVAVDEDIPEEATKVHGITADHARDFGGPLPVILSQVRGDLADAWAVKAPVVGMNLAYDFTVLAYESARAGMPAFEVAGPVIDIYVIDKGVDRYRPGKRTLTDLCALYGVELHDAHDATADALASVAVARAMYARATQAIEDPDGLAALYADRRYPREHVRAWQRLYGMSSADMFRLQQEWYAEQALSFAQYLRKQADQAEIKARRAPEPDREAALDEVATLRERALAVSAVWPVRQP